MMCMASHKLSFSRTGSNGNVGGWSNSLPASAAAQCVRVSTTHFHISEFHTVGRPCNQTWLSSFGMYVRSAASSEKHKNKADDRWTGVCGVDSHVGRLHKESRMAR